MQNRKSRAKLARFKSSRYCQWPCTKSKSLNSLFSCSVSSSEGAILGVGAALVSLCKEGLVDSRVHATAMHHKLRALLVEHEKDPGLKLQVS